MSLSVGEVIKFERTFITEDVRKFREISKDEASHHISPDEQGRLFIHGLLTATLPTKIGGDHNVLARTMNFEFIRPVLTGDTIVCEVTIDEFEKHDYRTHIKASFVCKNQHKKEVLTGDFSGIIR